MKELAKERLIQYESSGLRYNGYRLTWKGYDYLGIKTLVTRGVLQSFGTQIGTGKESNIYSGTSFYLYLCLPTSFIFYTRYFPFIILVNNKFVILVMGSPDRKIDDNSEDEEGEEEQLCLKLHRLGRTCFRKVS